MSSYGNEYQRIQNLEEELAAYKADGATQIVAITAENERLKEELSVYQKGWHHDEVVKVQAERDQYLVALERIAGEECECCTCGATEIAQGAVGS